jgi:hypothetical protein
MTSEELRAKAIELVEMRWARRRGNKRAYEHATSTGAAWSDLEQAIAHHRDHAGVREAKEAASRRLLELSDQANEDASEFLKANPDIAPWLER